MDDVPTYALLKSRALIAVTGPDWRGFLQGLISQDVETLQPGEARFGALLTPQGRLLYDLFLVGREDGCWLDVLAEHREAIIQRLTMYRLRAKVQIAKSDVQVSAAFTGSALTPPHPTLSPQGGEGYLKDPRLPDLGWRGYGVEADGDESRYEAHCLALGVPGPADWGSDKTYPIEANFDLLNGIDFHKGCYVGQETTSRMKRRGQIKSRMLPIAFEGPPPSAGAEVLAGELRAGQVLSVGDGRAMALMRLDRAEGGSLTVDGRPVTLERPAWFKEALSLPL
jgi:folate-binding protein YgfZ